MRLELVKETASPPAGSALTLSTGLTPPASLSGLQLGLPYGAYDKDPALRISVLDRISVSPLFLKSSLEEGDKESSAKLHGRVFHTLTLQPEELEATTVVVDAATRTAKAYKAARAHYPQKSIILRKEFDALCRMRDRFHSKALNRSFLKGADVEVSCFWTDPVTELRCKARPDILGAVHLVDIKSTRAIRYFRQDAEIYGYIRQMAWYVDGARAVTGRRIEHVILIAIEKKAPFDTQIFELGPKALAKASAENDKNIAEYSRCLSANEWPGYPEVIEELAP